MGEGGAYRVHAVFVRPGDAARKALDEQGAGVELLVLAGEHQGRFVVGVERDVVLLVAGVDEQLLSLVSNLCQGAKHGTDGDLDAAELGGEVQGGVAPVVDVRVADLAWVLGHDALDEEGVVEGDGAAQADRDVQPGGVS
jgi:hypothetical protein